MNSPGNTAALGSVQSEAVLGAEEQSLTRAKVYWRLIPLLFVCYVIAYVDRINVSFAKLHLQPVFKLDDLAFNAAYGTGAGLFFIGYFLFEVPSNLILQRVGARIWIARIMILWGLVSMSFMFLKTATMFYILRFCLGAAEAGFFPGVILYLTYWFPSQERARTVAWFATGGVLAGVIGSPISGALLDLDGLGGLAGWKWLFLIEAIPAVLLGLVVLFVLPNRPRDAKWLSPAEKAWVQGRVEADAASAQDGERHLLKEVFYSPRVWLLCLLYFLMNVGGYGIEMWLPTFVEGFSKTLFGEAYQGRKLVIGLIAAIPYLAAGITMVLVARHSDKLGERRNVVVLSAATSAVCFALSAYFKNPYLAMAALALAFSGLKSTIAPFWAMSTAFLGGTAAAAGIAFINSVGNLGGFVGSKLVGIVKNWTGSNTNALLALGGALLGMAIFTLLLPRKPLPQ